MFLSKKIEISFNKGTIKRIPKRNPIGKYFSVFLDKLLNLDSNIITANKNRIAIAPTYTTIKSRAINSHSSKNNKKAELKKLKTKNKRENTGCEAIITIKALITKNIENK